MSEYEEKRRVFSFSKEERLKSRNEIKELFANGSSFYLYPFKILFIKSPTTDTSTQVLFTVPKRAYKRAVDRNKIRRRIKEAYRLNKHLLFTSNNDQYSLKIAYIYVGKKAYNFEFIQQKLVETLTRLNKNSS